MKQSLITKYITSTVGSKLNTFLINNYKLNNKTLEPKSFTIQLGFLIDFIYSLGYTVVVVEQGFKIMLVIKNDSTYNLDLPIEEDGYTIYIEAVKNNILKNYYIALDKLFYNINKSSTPF